MAKTPKNLDEFFKEKLDQHSVTPSALAWERLENQLPQKPESNKGIWWAIAASISLLLMAGFLYWPKSENISQENLMAEEVQQEVIQENQPEIEEPTILEPSSSQPEAEETQEPTAQPVQKPETKKKSKPTIAPSSQSLPQNLIAKTETKQVEEIKSVERPDLKAGTPEVSLPPIETSSLNQTIAEANTSEEPLYRVNIYSDGIKKEEETKNLITELGKTVSTVEGFIGKVDNGFADLQDAKNNIFATLTSKKERADQKP
jgi:outer membrane biosynthesis protein TonB